MEADPLLKPIPCTVAVLTHNSADVLERALLSVAEFAQIVICDGGSTDETLEVARRFKATVITQDTRYLQADGRIADFSGVRNQTLDATTQDWFFFLDSDEYLSPALVEEIRTITTQGVPDAYWVPRKYVLEGTVIEHASNYPTRQMRFFHRDVAKRFIKQVHERIELKDGVDPKILTNAMLVPLLESAKDMRTKWRYYLSLEAVRNPRLSLWQGVHGAAREFLIAILFAVRYLRIVLFKKGTHLPFSYELSRLWYQWASMVSSVIRIRYI